MDLLLQPRYIFLGSFTSQKLIAGYKDLPSGLCYIFLVPYTDQEKALTHAHPRKQLFHIELGVNTDQKHISIPSVLLQ